MVIASAKEEPATPAPLFPPAFVAEPLRTRVKVPRKPWAVRGEIAVVDIKDGKGAKARYGDNATPVVLYVQAARSAGVGKSKLPGYQPKDLRDAQVLCPVHGCRRTYGSVRAAERHIDCSKESAHREYAESVEYSRVRRFTKWKTEHKCKFCEWETKSGRSEAVTRHEKLHLPGGSLHNVVRKTAGKDVGGSSGGEQIMAI
ncbi:hypothetical protein PENSPDRAFT_651773 [Peniophora sp. CONT]|nr:hypothetical protein PENSPDRAFT_651773 [Peniophora sp. CONT]